MHILTFNNNKCLTYGSKPLIYKPSLVIDGKRYNIVTIGNQTWMAESLDLDIPNSWYYNNDEVTYGWNGKKYGRLYTWNAARDAANMVKGWHLPTKDDMLQLISNAGGDNVVGKKLKSTIDWSNGMNGTDEFGFAMYPSGGRLSSGSFVDIPILGHIWTEEYSINKALRYSLNTSNGISSYADDKSCGFSVRLIKGDNPSPDPTPVDLVIDGKSYKTVVIGKQIWMAENLDLNVSGSKYYNDDESTYGPNGLNYGRLYTWYAARNAANMVNGWHLPTEAEFDVFSSYIESNGTHLKSSTKWDGDNKSGWDAVPAGFYSSNKSQWCDVGNVARFWSNTATYSTVSVWHGLSTSSSRWSYDYYGVNTDYFSVRLVKDSV